MTLEEQIEKKIIKYDKDQSRYLKLYDDAPDVELAEAYLDEYEKARHSKNALIDVIVNQEK